MSRKNLNKSYYNYEIKEFDKGVNVININLYMY